jgi:hypothetical protein
MAIYADGHLPSKVPVLLTFLKHFFSSWVRMLLIANNEYLFQFYIRFHSFIPRRASERLRPCMKRQHLPSFVDGSSREAPDSTFQGEGGGPLCTNEEVRWAATFHRRLNFFNFVYIFIWMLSTDMLNRVRMRHTFTSDKAGSLLWNWNAKDYI